MYLKGWFTFAGAVCIFWSRLFQLRDRNIPISLWKCNCLPQTNVENAVMWMSLNLAVILRHFCCGNTSFVGLVLASRKNIFFRKIHFFKTELELQFFCTKSEKKISLSRKSFQIKFQNNFLEGWEWHSLTLSQFNQTPFGSTFNEIGILLLGKLTI